MAIFNNVTTVKSDKLAGWIVITRMITPLVILGLTLIYVFFKLLACLFCVDEEKIKIKDD